MFTKNIFKDKDTVADLVGNILEADYKVKKEELKGNQHKIDMNKNNKIDAHDFKLLRSKGTQKEEVDQIDELSSGTIDRYRKKLGTTLDTKPAYTTAAVAAQKEKNAPIRAKIHNALMKQHQAIRRERGMSEGVAEEVEQIDELNKDTLYSYNKKAGADVEKKDKSLGQLIRKGDSAGANKTARQLNNRLAGQERAEKRLNKEEVEQIDELKKSTLKSYTKKADAEVSDIKKKQAEHPRGHISGSDADKKLNRQIGINQATKRIVKKDLTGVAEEVEQFDERTLTPGETSEKERIVKGMKKSLSGFKQRYGDRAKSVMYATATKAAKKD